MAEQLKSCPFCGEDPEVFFPGGDETAIMIECITSDCVNPHVSFFGHGEAAKRWNHRQAN